MTENHMTSPELEAIFDKCVQVFLLRGYETSTLDDITKASGVTREFLDQHFSSKQELTSAALRWYYIKYSRQMRTEMAMHSDLYAAMEAVLFAFISISCDQVQAEKGLFVRTFIDISYVDKGLKKEFEALQDDWETQIIDKFTQCQSELKDPTEIDVLAHYFLTVIEGLYELIKYGTPCEMMRKVALISLEVLAAHMK
ncbi:TetR/AcrR family transcriptional regulator [Pseudovibrio sp. Tun.PSC04-5.I4]|uniref:TetR/AcrR family transcriptional regulator n=1 Tax=Pseudovibrio sp. Tun.PSC04-5.I4 TaxID=1798213 RepID=UPI001AD8A589|nr:TetR/AcrR family transcriptional regulator [Pseudovibrio sp. Tun.PSC04-5.I4]